MDCEPPNPKTDEVVLRGLQKAAGTQKRHLEDFRPIEARRRTALLEDAIYLLFGMFTLHLPFLYEESAEYAWASLDGDHFTLRRRFGFGLGWRSVVAPQLSPCKQMVPSDLARCDGVNLQCMNCTVPLSSYRGRNSSDVGFCCPCSAVNSSVSAASPHPHSQVHSAAMHWH